MKLSREVKTAILAIVAVILLIFGYSFLKGKNLLDNSRIFYAVYNNVEGLAPSSEVTINGLKVGSVTAIDFLDSKGRLVVTFTVNKDFEFSDNSIARVYGGGLIGGKSIEIVPNFPVGNPAQSGDTLQSQIEEGLLELVNERLTPLQEKIEVVITSTDSLLNSLNDVLNKETRDNLKGSIAEFRQTMVNLNGASQNVEDLIANNTTKLNRTFTNLDEMSGNLNNISDSIAQINVGQIVNDLEGAIADFKSISDKLNNGEGTAAKLLNDDAIYNNLDRATRQLEELLQDIKLNPKRYLNISVFGRKSEPYYPPNDPLK
ncbi:MAG TPA: MlaD family protein [Salinimicrobium sp.]|nr:MlaD family protein [Salinimicrobium sp.]